jgi:non-specific serine/threonine protein kinase/serine/threonine-protein kinase
LTDDLTLTAPPAGEPSRAFGNYRLLEQIGEGGMGEVWLAEQLQPVRRKLAIKLIKAGMDTRQVVERFEAERQALAVMDHPGIAKVFDAGSTPEGRPYFAMEYVRGEPITAYCDRHTLSLGDRLELFLQICDGVQHAHQKGIIHRDLKPSNVLVEVVDGKACPKIIDFGIAKATAQPLTDRTLYTEVGSVMGTPEYMSPEQAALSGQDVDTRTDVYALGVILYELLTGALPLDTKTARASGLDEVRRTIREVQPARPSARGGTAAHQLRGDLDWITMRALEKERMRRYGSVSDFSADIRRHLRHEPVVAGPPRVSYRASKFLRRHRLGASIAAAGVMLLVMFAVTMAVQARRIAQERDRANLEAQAAKQTSDFLTGLFTVSDPSEARGNTLTATQILDGGAADLGRMLKDQPEIRARLQTTIGTVYINLGRYSAAEPC